MKIIITMANDTQTLTRTYKLGQTSIIDWNDKLQEMEDTIKPKQTVETIPGFESTIDALADIKI